MTTRAGEKAHYRSVLEAEGYAVEEIDAKYRFEGEADFFPAGDLYLLTHGRLEKQRFVPALGIPPWKRIYGFRTDVRAEGLLAPRVAPTPILKVGVVLEAHYHGDTALCAFGSGRENLLLYREAIAPDDLPALEDRFGERLLGLSIPDAERYLRRIEALAEQRSDLRRGDLTPVMLPYDHARLDVEDGQAEHDQTADLPPPSERR